MHEAGLLERPASWNMGHPLKLECNIQHRSDILMKEQVKNIKSSEELLTSAVGKFESAKSCDVEKCQQVVKDTQQDLEKKILILQVMHKINIELAYARADLDSALYQNVGDINAARKRVIWLEDKMGDLCGKKRLKSQPVKSIPQTSSNDGSVAQPVADSDFVDVETKLVSQDDLKKDLQSGEINSNIVDEVTAVEGDKISDEVTAVKGDDISDEVTAVEGDDISDEVTAVEGDNISDEVTAVEADDIFDEDDENNLVIIRLFPNEDELDEKELNSNEVEETELSAADLNEKTDSNRRSSSQLTTNSSDDSTNQDTTRKNEQTKPTFLTEISRPVSKNALTVTSSENNKKGYICTVEEDAVREYWNSEHHRFDVGEYFNKLIENDPLSYHNLGIAVPGCFIDREDSEFNDLPWRLRRKESDIKDVHRIALDKLAAKLKRMYCKVYDAAMLSVLPSERQASSRQNTVTTNKLISRGSGKKSQDTFALPKVVTKKRVAASGSTKLVYYPKPIPPPEVLPITRTSKDKEFPRFADAFSVPGADIRHPALRIADQRNLIGETKLVLYREKPKPKREGPSTTERRFRRMLERDRTLSTASSKKLKKTFLLAKNLVKLQGGEDSSIRTGGWQSMKPRGKGKEYSGLRWERVKSIVHTNLLSIRAEERTDAAKQLGLLRCGDTMVFYALKERLEKDNDERVRYEAAKSLILIGCWDNEVLQVILKFLVTGNTEIRLDLIINMAQGKNVQYVDKSISSFKELVKVLSHFCCNPDPDDSISFEAAVLLGKLCVADYNAKAKLYNALTTSDDSHIKAKALEILVKQLNCTDERVVKNIKDLLNTSPVSKHRALATKLLISLGPYHSCVKSDAEDIYNLLERKLWDEPSHDVRVSAGKALTALGMFSRACESVEKRLEDREEETRSEAVVSVGTLGMRSEKLTRLLLEMLELDASEYVRIMIIRTFSTLKLTDKRVIRCLREREKLDGFLGLESRKAVKVLEACIQESTPKLSIQKTQPLQAHHVSAW